MANDVASGAAQGAAAGAAGGVGGAVAGGTIGLIGSLIGNSSAKRAARAQAEAAARNAALWGSIQIPSIEDQQIILQNPDLMGQYTPEQLQYMGDMTSSMEGVAANQATIDSQNEALKGISEVAKGGFTEGDKAAMRESERGVNQQSQARQKAILNSMASRGVLGSGAELAAQLQGNQQSLDQAGSESNRILQAAQARSLQALGQQGQLSGQMRSQEFGEKSDVAKARDTINQFNQANKQNISNTNVGNRNQAQLSNLEARQALEQQRASNANAQQQYNKGLLQTQFSNQVAKTAGQTGSNTEAANAQANQLNLAGQQQKNLFGSVASGALQGYQSKFADGGLVVDPNAPVNPDVYLNPNQEKINQFYAMLKAANALKSGYPIAAKIEQTGSSVPYSEDSLSDEQNKFYNSTNFGSGGEGGYANGGLVIKPQIIDGRNDDQIRAEMAQNQLNQDYGNELNIPEVPPETPAPVAPTVLDPRYTAAMDERSKIQGRAGLLDTFLSAMEGSGTGYKANRSAVDSLNKMSENPVNDYKQLLSQEELAKKTKADASKEQRESESHKMLMDKSKMELDFNDSLNKPGSPVSLSLAATASEKLKKLGMNIPEEQIKNMSANQISKAFPFLQDDLKAAADQENQRLERISKEKIANEANKIKTDKEVSFADKEEIKAEAKDTVKIKAENRKERKKLETDLKTWENLKTQIDDAIAKTKAYQKDTIGGTGIGASIKSLSGSLAPDTQALNTSLKKLAMDQLVKQFAGMSKAIDTPAERSAFEATVPTLAMDDALLIEELTNRKAAADAAIAKTKQGMSQFDRTGEFIDNESRNPGSQTPSDIPPKTGPLGDTTVREGRNYKWNAAAGKYQLFEQGQ